MKLQHFLGEFKDMAAVQAAFPGGGSEGDYLVVDGVIKGWDIESNTWADPIKKDAAPVRATEQVFGDLDVHHNLRVGGEVSARHIRGKNSFLGVFESEVSLRERYPDPCIGEWAMVFAYTTRPDGTEGEEVSRGANDIIIGYIFVCETDGEWKNSGFKGGYDDSAQIMEDERERAEAAEATLQGNIDAEAQARQQADASLQGNITAEVARATEAEEDVIYDVSARNNGMVYIVNPAYLIPESKRKNGMIIKFLTYRANCIVFDFGTNPDSEQRDKINNAIRLSGKMPFDKSGRYLIPAVLAAIVGTDYETILTAISENLQEVGDEVTFYTTVEENEGTRYFYYKIVRELGAYAFYRNEAATFDTSASSWISVDFKVRENSQHLATSGMVYDAVNAEAQARQQADIQEAQARQQADAGLGDAIETVNSKIPNAASSSNKLVDTATITAEATARQQADATLQRNINAEVEARENAFANLTFTDNVAGSAVKQTAAKYDLQMYIGDGEYDILAEITLESATTQKAGLMSAYDKGAFNNIQDMIPSEAGEDNQLADKDFVNSSIATNTATFRGTYNLVSDLRLNVNASFAQIAAALAGVMQSLSIVPDNSDYVFVRVPTETSKPTEIARTDRFKYNGTAWGFEYELNNSGFTAAQWAAINSGVTQQRMSSVESGLATEQSNREYNDNLLQQRISTEQQRAQIEELKTLCFHINRNSGVTALELNIPGYSLSESRIFNVEFNTTIDFANATLNITETGAKSLYYNGEPLSANNKVKAHDKVQLYYDSNTDVYQIWPITKSLKEYIDGTVTAEAQARQSADDAIIFDISEYNAVNGEPKVYLDLVAAEADIPNAKRKEGMVIKFLTYSVGFSVQDFGITPTEEQQTLIENAVQLSRAPFPRDAVSLIPSYMTYVNTKCAISDRSKIIAGIEAVVRTSDDYHFYVITNGKYLYFTIESLYHGSDPVSEYIFYTNISFRLGETYLRWKGTCFEPNKGEQDFITGDTLYEVTKEEKERAQATEQELIQEVTRLQAIISDIETIAEGYVRVAGSSSPALSYKSYKYHEQGGFGRESVFSLFYPCLVGTPLTGSGTEGKVLHVLQKFGARTIDGTPMWIDIYGTPHKIDSSEGDVLIVNIEDFYSINGKHVIEGTEYDVFLMSRTPFTWQGIEAEHMEKFGWAPDYTVAHQDTDNVIRMHSVYNPAWNGSYTAPQGVAGKYVYSVDPETGDIVETYDANETLLGGAGGLHSTDINLPNGEQYAMNNNDDPTKTVPWMNQTAEGCNRLMSLILAEGGTFDAHNANLMGSGFCSNDPATAAGDWEQAGSGAKNGLRVMDKNGVWKYYALSGNVRFLTGATTGTVYAANVINLWRNPWHILEAHRAMSYAIENDVHELEWFVFEGNKYKYRSVQGFNGPSHGEMTCVVWKIMATQAGAAAIDPTDNATSIAGNRVEILVSTALIHGMMTQVSPLRWTSGLLFTEDENGQYECYLERDQAELVKGITADNYDPATPRDFETIYDHVLTVQKGEGYAKNYLNGALMLPDTNANKSGAGLHTYVGKYNWFTGGNASAGKKSVRGFLRGFHANYAYLSPLTMDAYNAPSNSYADLGFGTCCRITE